MIVFDDAREMERRASMCYTDGLLDIVLGIGLLILGLGLIFGIGAIAVAYCAVIYSLMKMAKRIVTAPRMHHLDFMPDPDAESRLGRARGLASAAVAVLVGLGVVAFFMSRFIPARISAGLRGHAIVIFGVALAALFGLLAWGTATRRQRVYALIAVLMLVFAYWFDLGAGWYVTILGAVSVAWGASALSHFLKEYPRFYHRSGKVSERFS